MTWPWSELGLPGPAGLPEIRRAYARRLRTTHPEDDPEGFQRLHAAYREAGRQARHAARPSGEPPEAPPLPPLEEKEAEREPEAGWDCEELLEEGAEEWEEPQSADWDYERLLAEGEAEAREARRRELELLGADRRKKRRRALCAACLAALAGFLLIGWSFNLGQTYRDFIQRRSAEKWEAQSIAWLEEDFGEPFALADGENHLYTPASDSTLYFWVLPDGERAADGRPGYRTDYPHMRVMRAMEDFAEKWDLGLEFDSAGDGYSGKTGDAPGAYLFDLPLEGAEEAISALGALTKELEAQNWNHVPAEPDREETIVEYQIFLCHNGLSFYDAISTREGGFDAETVLIQYETAGNAYCRYIVEHGGLAAKHMGENAYALLDWGTAEIEDSTFFLVAGLDKQSLEPLVRYFMAPEGRAVFCVPEGKHISSPVDLYRGFASFVEVERVGRVMIWDLA